MLKNLHEMRTVSKIVVLALILMFSAAPVAIAEKKININTATAEKLATLPKIGPKTAAAIIKYRKKHSFKTIEELQEVKGIGEKKFQLIKPLITVGEEQPTKSQQSP